MSPKPMNKCSSCGKETYSLFGKGNPSVCYDCYKKGDFKEAVKKEDTIYVPLREDGLSFYEAITGNPKYNGRECIIDGRGYVRFKDNNKLVHREIAYHEIYLPNKQLYPLPFGKYVIHHKDGYTGNNNPSNLELLTRQEHNKLHEDKSCFIATAAYGTPFAQEIEVLRTWRDLSLKSNLMGMCVVKIYYKISPPIADFISTSNDLKKIVRTILNPFVKILKKEIQYSENS